MKEKELHPLWGNVEKPIVVFVKRDWEDWASDGQVESSPGVPESPQNQQE